ncbi:hypothetical protein V3481_012425 [Fusarium oxysporum f. sp. vasinfectum]
MIYANQDLSNRFLNHVASHDDLESQFHDHDITNDCDDQQLGLFSASHDYENTCAPGQYTEQPMPLVSHNICNDISQRETGSPTSTDIDNYPFKRFKEDCGYAFKDSRDLKLHTKKSKPPDGKMVLKIYGDLASMTEDWTLEECANSRRIVFFQKTRRESTVEVTCQTASTKQRNTRSICISCIWWAEKSEYYVTSVDIIHLLENLIAEPRSFSDMEKKIIRRKLEKFDPKTVYKAEPDSQEFFKIIKSFPDPKPLNMGKDIKVFLWKDLESALKEMIGKITTAAPNAESGQRGFTTPGSNDSAQLYRISTESQQAYSVTETGSPGGATVIRTTSTNYQLPQGLGQSLTGSSRLVSEIDTLTDDYLSTFCATPAHDNILPEGFYADYAESQPAQYHRAPCADMSRHPGHSSSSQLATFPTSQRPSSFQRRPEAQVSNDLLPEQCLSQAQISKQLMGEIQSEYVPRCQLPAQSDVPVDPALLSGAQIDSNPKQAAMPRVSTKTSPATGGVLSRPNKHSGLGKKPPRKNMQGAKVAKKNPRQGNRDNSQRPFECKTCGRGFRRQYDIKRHNKTCDPQSAASVTSGSVSGDIDQEEGDNNYLNASTNSNCGRGKIDGRINDSPELVRTRTIAQKTGMGSYCHISGQAVLKIAGKLESLAENWTSEEWLNRRRVVLFRKTQKGATINATYQSVSVNDIPPGSICISCIWWAEKGEYYVTSVDIVYLLEQLIVGPKRFDEQEKGRVRGNLDIFKSERVSKIDPRTRAFFDIIMGFSSPKPRNIEKDIKLFPWKILGHILKGVFGKYSISPSHTVSALNVDPDQRTFTMPKSQRILPPPRRSSTPQQACRVTELGSPGGATVIRTTSTNYQLPQGLEQSLTESSPLAPEIEILTDNYLSTFCATPAHDNILPEGFYADYAESQPAQYHRAPCADMSRHPGHSSSSQLATFPTSQCHSSFQRRPEAPVSDNLLPEQCLSHTQVSKQPIEEIHSRQVSVCQSPAQRGVPVDPALTSDIQSDSNAEESETHRGDYYSLSQESTPLHSERCFLPTGSILTDYTNPDVDQEAGGNDCLDTPTNSDYDHTKVDGRTQDTIRLVGTSIGTQKAVMNFPDISLRSSKAFLKINGELASMAENWTPEEKANSRRVVLFHKTQKESTVNATCHPVSVNERPTNSICISCIWWAEKGKCYITSTDIIDLLDYLVAKTNRFTVEEKNRVRSNLDMFGPSTVSEKEPESQDFFKIIMGFSDPKPYKRKNSVRVYPWKKLESALETIVSKYGVSPGSTTVKSPPPQYHMAQPQILNITSLHMGASHHAQLSGNSLTGLTASADQAPPTEQAHEKLQQDCAQRVEAAAPSSVRTNKIYSNTSERPFKCLRMDCDRISRRQEYLTHHPRTGSFPSKPELSSLPSMSSELPVLSTSNIIREGPSGFPQQARPDPDPNPLSLQNGLNLLWTLSQGESDSDSAEDNIVVCVRSDQDRHTQNVPTLSPEEHFDGVDDTNPDTEEQARDNKPTINLDHRTLQSTLPQSKEPEIQKFLYRLYDSFLQTDIEHQQEAETRKSMTQFQIDVMEIMMLHLGGPDLRETSADELDDRFKRVWEALIQ